MKKRISTILLLLLSSVSIESLNAQLVDGAALSSQGNNPGSGVIIASNNSLDLTEFTVETWFNWSSSGSSVEFIFSRGNGIELHTGGTFNNSLRFIPTAGVYLDAPADVFVPGTWNHLAVVYKPAAAYAKMYINGNEVPLTNNGTSPITTPVSAITNDWATDLLLCNRVGGAFPFNGKIDEFRLWNKALTQTEIQFQRNCEIQNNSCNNDLIVNMHFNQGVAVADNTTITQVNDASGNNNNGQIQGFSLTGNTSNFIEIGAVTSGNSCAQSTFSVDTRTECDSLVWLDGNTYTAANNTATYTIINPSGCDSVLTLDLSIRLSTFGVDTRTECDALVWIDGNTYTSSNNSATYTLTNASGCDSVVTLDLTINSLNLEVIENATSLTAMQTDATYQWVNCSTNFTPISGATNQSFTPTIDGDYAVIITMDGCSDTSACTAFLTNGLSELNSEMISVYPNPANGVLTIEKFIDEKLNVEIYNSLGKSVFKGILEVTKNTIDLSGFSNGIYTIKLNSVNQSATIKISKI